MGATFTTTTTTTGWLTLDWASQASPALVCSSNSSSSGIQLLGHWISFEAKLKFAGVLSFGQAKVPSGRGKFARSFSLAHTSKSSNWTPPIRRGTVSAAVQRQSSVGWRTTTAAAAEEEGRTPFIWPPASGWRPADVVRSAGGRAL